MTELNPLIIKTAELYQELVDFTQNKGKEAGKTVVSRANANFVLNLFDKLKGIIYQALLDKNQAESRAHAIEQQTELRIHEIVQQTESRVHDLEQQLKETRTDFIEANGRLQQALETFTGASILPASDYQEPTYATVAARQQKKVKSSHKAVSSPRDKSTEREKDRISTVVLRPVEGSNLKGSTDIRKSLQQHIQCAEIGVSVRKIHPTKKNNLIVKVDNADQAIRLIETVKSVPNLNQQIQASVPKAKLSRLLISRVPSCYQEKQIVEFLIAKRKWDSSAISFRQIGKKNTAFNTWVVTLPESYAELLIQEKYLNFNFLTVTVKPFLTIIRCYNCQNFGHFSTACNFETVCATCSETHKTTDCTSESQLCVNCFHHSRDIQQSRHCASSSQCHTYQQLLLKCQDRPALVIQW